MLKEEARLLELLNTGGDQRDAAFKTLYLDLNLRRMAWGQMNRYNPASEAAFEEIWQETMLGLLEAIAKHRFLGESSLNTYIVRIAVNKWLSVLKKTQRSQRHEISSNQLPDAPIPDLFFEFGLDSSDEQYKELLDYAIRQLSERCQGMLKDAADGGGIGVLTERYAFSSKNMAKKEAYNCRERLRKFIRSKPLLQEKLKDWLYRTNFF